LRTNPHLIVDLSGHGYGHAGMTMPVLNALRVAQPGLKLTIRTTVSVRWLAERIEGPFDFVHQPDFGMAMADARQVLPDESMAIYSCIHEDWTDKITAATKQLAALKPTLLLSNVTYVSLSAAKRLGIPAIAFGPLNWADIFYHYCINLPGAQNIWTHMVESYASAESFLQTAPFMPMPSIRNGHAVGPVAQIGQERKRELRKRLGLANDCLLILVALRGIPTKFSISNWPKLNDMCVLVGPEQELSHPDVISVATLDIPYIDLIRSCDVVITKPGYGLVTEAACNGTPMLLLPWEDWPETPGLMDWLNRHGRVLTLTDEKLLKGKFLPEVQKVLAMRAPPMPPPSGVAEVIEKIGAYFSK
jgi:hypothetical protein